MLYFVFLIVEKLIIMWTIILDNFKQIWFAIEFSTLVKNRPLTEMFLHCIFLHRQNI